MLIEQFGLPKNISDLVDAAVNYGYNSNDAEARQALVDQIKMIKTEFEKYLTKTEVKADD